MLANEFSKNKSKVADSPVPATTEPVEGVSARIDGAKLSLWYIVYLALIYLPVLRSLGFSV